MAATSSPVLTQQYLKTLFDDICDPHDWRKPIAAWVDPNMFDQYNAAVLHFTGTPLERIIEATDGEYPIAVRAVGYRAGPCGP